ncbi:hypothetical protein DFH06DRAFT_1462804 [Mycena polygramma]|nr:hypothetical protein DFH06DRAFT_1462804 [Mycena polygramma]
MIVEVPRSGAGIVNTTYRRPASGVKSLVSKRPPAGTLPLQLQFAVACAMHVNATDAVEFCCHSPAFDFQHPAKHWIKIRDFAVPRTEAPSAVPCLPPPPSPRPDPQNSESSFESPASKMMGLLLCRRRRCPTPTSVHHRPLCPWLDRFEFPGPLFNHELLRTFTHRSHSPLHLLPVWREVQFRPSTPLSATETTIEFKIALNVQFQPILGHLGLGRFSSPTYAKFLTNLVLYFQLPLPVCPTLLFHLSLPFYQSR